MLKTQDKSGKGHGKMSGQDAEGKKESAILKAALRMHKKPTKQEIKKRILKTSKKFKIDKSKLKMDDIGDIYAKKWQFNFEGEIDRARINNLGKDANVNIIRFLDFFQ